MFRPYIWGLKFIVRTDHASLKWLFRQNADGMTFRMLQNSQEYEFEVVHRPGIKHGNADGLSRTMTDEIEWEPGEREEMTGQCPEPKPLGEALEEVKGHVWATQAVTVDEDEPLTWSRTETEVSTMQREDESIRVILEWCDAANVPDQTALSGKPTSREQVLALGPDVLAYWAIWEQLTLKAGLLYRKWHKAETRDAVLQLVLPEKARKEIIDQLHGSPVSGGHFAIEKTLARIKQRFWWPGMRRDVEKRIS